MTAPRLACGKSLVCVALAVLACLQSAASAPLKPSTRVMKEKLASEETADTYAWHEWLHAFELADTDSDGKLHISDIPALYKEHFNKIMAATPHHSGPDRVVREQEEVFLEEAELFKKHVIRNGTPGHDTFDFHDFKKLMTNYMHVKADLRNYMREL